MAITTPNLIEGLCQCGCGKPTPPYPRSRHTLKTKKGEPSLYLPGHQNRQHLSNDLEGFKTCSQCNEMKSLDDFGKSTRSPDGHRPECRLCRRKDAKLYYENLSEEKRSSRQLAEEKRRNECRTVVLERFEEGCSDCGQKDIRVLEFDHVKGNKEANMSTLIRNGTITSLRKEIEKCDVVCANCHRIRTTAQFKWWRGDILSQ